MGSVKEDLVPERETEVLTLGDVGEVTAGELIGEIGPDVEPIKDAPTGELAVLDQTGDTKTIWSKDNEAEVAAARATFDALKKKGYAGYSVTAKGEKGEVMKTFDPDAEKIIMAPPMVGG